MLALLCVRTGEFQAAEEAAAAALTYGYIPVASSASLLLGIARLRQRKTEAAKQAFKAAIDAVEATSANLTEDYDALDCIGLAHCGLALVDDSAHVGEARAAFNMARQVTTAPGSVARVLRQFDAIAAADEREALAGLRAVAAGDNAISGNDDRTPKNE
jgi:hypothetical protein